MNNSFTRQQIADLLGLNKETLRFYEHEGIISPQRKANGYRSYDLDDVRMLIEIISYREAGISLADAKTLAESLTFDEAVASITSLIKERELAILREQEMLKFYQDILAPLKKVNQCKGTFATKSLGPWYSIDDREKISRAALIEECYIIETWIEEDGAWSISSTELYRNNSVGVTPSAERGVAEDETPCILETACAYTVVECKSWTMDADRLQHAAAQARTLGYALTNTAYCLSISHHCDKSHAEIYFPLARP